MTGGHVGKGLMQESMLADRKWQFPEALGRAGLGAGAVSGHRNRALVLGSTPEKGAWAARGISDPYSWPVYPECSWKSKRNSIDRDR